MFPFPLKPQKSESMAGSSIMENLFQRTTEDLIKGLRLSLVGESAFISKAMDEIRREIKSTDMDTKSTAIQKLSFLSSLHFYDMSFASFHVVELISSPRFSHKRIAYSAAANSFRDSTSVLLLLTNHIRKDLSAPNPYEVTIALQCLSMIATLDLARDLTPEILTLLGSSKLSVRKKAVAVTLRFFEKYPDSARVCFKRLAESLESPDSGVLSAVVGVFCELAARDPTSYLPLAPEFYRVFVDCKNNWVLIKVLKIFARLAPLEPRLAKRVIEPICDLMRRNSAKSVAFECVRTIVSSFGGFESAVRLAVGKVREFLAEDDPNLKYLALKALSIAARDHPWVVSENKEAVIESLSDPDPSVKRESLNLVMAMVTEANAAEISRVLMNYAIKSDPEFCNEILGSILATCEAGVYEIVSDFDRYVSLLGEMSRVPHCRKGAEIERQLVDIGVRVRDARPELVRVARDLLIDPALLGNHFLHGILSAAAWVSGEYVEFSRNPLELVDALLQPRANLLPPSIRAVYIHSVFKVLVFCLHAHFSDGIDESEDISGDSVANLLNKIESGVMPLLGSHNVEVVERARNLIRFVELIRRNEAEACGIVEVVQDVLSDELGPVSATAQERVLVPEGLDLKENLEELDPFLPEFQTPPLNTFSLGSSPVKEEETGVPPSTLLEKRDSNESTSLLAQHRKRHGLYYLPLEEKSNNGEEASENYPPANELDAAVDLSNKKKPSQTKPRPVVVKLDGDVVRDSGVKARSSDHDSLSGAVREALFGSDSKPNSSEKKSSKGKEIVYADGDAPESKEDSGIIDETRKSKSRSEKKSSRRHSKHKSRKRTDAAPQTQDIPDFLL